MAGHPSPPRGRRRVPVRHLAIAATALLALLIGAARPSPAAAASSSSFMPRGVGTPATAVTPSGAQVVFWKGAANHLFEAWYTGGWNGPVDVSGAYFNNATLTSSPAVAVTPGGTQVVFWQSGNDLVEAWYDTSWHGPVDWSSSVFKTTTAGGGSPPPVTSAPAAAVTRDGSAQLVFWASNGHLIEAYYTSSGWHGPVEIDGGVTNGQITVGIAGGLGATTTSDGSQYVVWRGSNGHLIEVRYTVAANTWGGPVDVTATNLGGQDLLASPPSIASTANDTLLVFWQGLTGHLDEAWAAPGWSGPVDWTASTFHGAQPLTSSPTVAVTPDSSQTQIVFWQSAGSRLSEAWWNGAWNGPVGY